MWEILFSILYICIHLFAGYVSWTCKANRRLPILLRLIYALLAVIFGWIYLIFYVILWIGECAYPASESRKQVRKKRANKAVYIPLLTARKKKISKKK